jgi:hypothetical protein
MLLCWVSRFYCFGLFLSSNCGVGKAKSDKPFFSIWNGRRRV